MIFHTQTADIQKKFVFSGEISALAHPILNTPVIREFFHSFTFRAATLSVTESEVLTFSVGTTEPLALENEDYSLRVTENGVALAAKNETSLLHAFMTLLDLIRANDDGDGIQAEIGEIELRESARIGMRMVHFCIFPETELWELRRFVRFAGALKYTHIVLEFWGMLRYDCMKELAWSSAFTKDDIRPILDEARALGLDIIPMFNHWGHAAQGRVMHGKHVVLDQNPTLQTYFSEDGWCWDIRKEKVRALLREIRRELLDFCGGCSYFHIGCDEAYNFPLTRENMDFLSEFVNEIAEELEEKNARVILWGDMLLYRHPYYNPKNRYTCNAPTPEVEAYMLSHLDRKIVIADWQYDSGEAPIETVDVFRRAGFDTLLCPWDRGVPEMRATISTVLSQGLSGVMHTTWHTLSKGMPYVALCAVGGFHSIDEVPFRQIRTSAAALLRKVMPIDGDYEKAGWSRRQVYSLW